MNLLEGEEQILCRLGSLAILDSVEGQYCRHSPRLGLRQHGGELAWAVRLEGLEEDTLSSNQGSAVADFRAHLSSSCRWVLLAGNNKAVLVDLESGAIVGEASLRQTGTSIDVLKLLETGSGGVVVVSSWRIVEFTSSGEVANEIESQGPVTTVFGIEGNHLLVRRFDVNDPALPKVEEFIPLGID